MAKLKLLVGLLIALIVMGIGWWFSSENSLQVRPVLMSYELPEWNLGAWLFVALLTGVLLGYFVSMFENLRFRGKANSLQRKLTNREQEIAKLRSISLKE